MALIQCVFLWSIGSKALTKLIVSATVGGGAELKTNKLPSLVFPLSLSGLNCHMVAVLSFRNILSKSGSQEYRGLFKTADALFAASAHNPM